MSSSVDINIGIDELYRRILENKKRVVEYVRSLSEAYDKVMSIEGIPEDSERIVIDIPNAHSIVIYRNPSKRAYKDLFSRALALLRLEYAVYEVLEGRLGRLKGRGFKAMVRYMGDVPTVTVIGLDGTEER
ncbi:MAG: hypothetical protein L7H10_05530 [Vulcanisaeta sp.]|jgi:hypothetical protein|nr:hypothetical protein [Vulcanisaeta sp.]MCG2870195.1 hypothetical protein [Vulcanisaeta sp.]MCG2886437.1 hypothetical protein [Vulcanisaeta sp.]